MRLLIHLIPFLSLFPALFSSLLALSQTTCSPHHTDDNSSHSLLGSFFTSVTTALERATEEKSLLLNKIGDINEVSRQEVDEMINMFARKVCVSSSDNIQKRYSLSCLFLIEMFNHFNNVCQFVVLSEYDKTPLIISYNLMRNCISAQCKL